MTLTYTARESGKTVYTVMRRELFVSASLLRRLKAADAIRVNGRREFTDFILSSGDVLTLALSLAEPPLSIIPERGGLEVLWETDGLFAVNKPPGVLVHPSRSKYTGTLLNFAAGYTGGACHAVNRLDRDTSGVVLFAKCAYWKELAVRALRESGEKEYMALVFGRPEHESGTVDAPIRRFRETDMLRVVAPDGKPAVTGYETVWSSGGVSLLRLRLVTGRTHQIRVHMLHIGCPLLGDTLYKTPESEAASEAFGIAAQALHASRLSFDDPFSGARIEISAGVRRSDMSNIAKRVKMPPFDP